MSDPSADSKKLIAANDELRTLTHILSHDLKSPLFSIYQIAQMLLTQPQLEVEECRVVLTAISDDALRLTEMTAALHKFYMMALNEMVITTVDISALAGDILAKLVSNSPYRQIETIIEPGLKVSGDATLIQIMLESLFQNAIKFTSKVVEPRIEFGQLTPTVKNPGADDCQTFFVKDNGAGFDMQLAHKLFKPFQRLHASSDFEGTGIGLATVDRVASRHDGQAWVKAARGEGATFYFSLAKLPLS